MKHQSLTTVNSVQKRRFELIQQVLEDYWGAQVKEKALKYHQ
ncbi:MULTISPECIES: hypothetical protein [unclassified Niallia]|nr:MULTISPECIES: hypothetical protein [unclassified Niallia]